MNLLLPYAWGTASLGPLGGVASPSWWSAPVGCVDPNENSRMLPKEGEMSVEKATTTGGLNVETHPDSLVCSRHRALGNSGVRHSQGLQTH